MAADHPNPDEPLVLTRHFRYPRALVFEAWTTGDHVAKWIAPRGFTARVTVDFRVGGVYDLVLVGYGMEHRATGVYTDIVPLERIAIAIEFSDVPGLEMRQTITFADKDGGTELVMRQDFPPLAGLSPQVRELVAPRMRGAPEGWSQSLQHFAEYLATR